MDGWGIPPVFPDISAETPPFYTHPARTMPRRTLLGALLVSLLALSADGASIALGGSHSCALRGDGTVKCWGYNIQGQLGDGTTTHRTTPVEVSGMTNATSIALGSYHSCALLGNGKVTCWGRDNAGGQWDVGELGSTTPVEVSGITTATSIALGVYYHSCAVLTDGKVRAPLRDPKTPFFATFVGVLSFAFISCALVDAVVRLAGIVLGGWCVRAGGV